MVQVGAVESCREMSMVRVWRMKLGACELVSLWSGFDIITPNYVQQKSTLTLEANQVP